jgi:hypothetical protein
MEKRKAQPRDYGLPVGARNLAAFQGYCCRNHFLKSAQTHAECKTDENETKKRGARRRLPFLSLIVLSFSLGVKFSEEYPKNRTEIQVSIYFPSKIIPHIIQS